MGTPADTLRKTQPSRFRDDFLQQRRASFVYLAPFGSLTRHHTGVNQRKAAQARSFTKSIHGMEFGDAEPFEYHFTQTLVM